MRLGRSIGDDVPESTRAPLVSPFALTVVKFDGWLSFWREPDWPATPFDLAFEDLAASKPACLFGFSVFFDAWSGFVLSKPINSSQTPCFGTGPGSIWVAFSNFACVAFEIPFWTSLPITLVLCHSSSGQVASSSSPSNLPSFAFPASLVSTSCFTARFLPANLSAFNFPS